MIVYDSSVRLSGCNGALRVTSSSTPMATNGLTIEASLRRVGRWQR